MMRYACRAGFVVLVLAGWTGAGNAQSTGNQSSKSVPKLDAEALKIPDSVRDADANKFKADKTQKALPQPGLPSKVDLGKYDLEFKAQHSDEVNPRTGFDSGEKSNLSNSSIGRQSESPLPNYFGLKLSTPTD
jgi:hypothetical protein